MKKLSVNVVDVSEDRHCQNGTGKIFLENDSYRALSELELLRIFLIHNCALKVPAENL